MVAPVEVGEGGVVLLVSSGLLREHQTRDRKAVGAVQMFRCEPTQSRTIRIKKGGYFGGLNNIEVYSIQLKQ